MVLFSSAAGGGASNGDEGRVTTSALEAVDVVESEDVVDGEVDGEVGGVALRACVHRRRKERPSARHRSQRRKLSEPISRMMASKSSLSARSSERSGQG